MAANAGAAIKLAWTQSVVSASVASMNFERFVKSPEDSGALGCWPDVGEIDVAVCGQRHESDQLARIRCDKDRLRVQPVDPLLSAADMWNPGNALRFRILAAAIPDGVIHDLRQDWVVSRGSPANLTRWFHVDRTLLV